MSHRVSILVCACLIALFAICAWLGATRQSPTIDEPICELAGYLHLHDGDFRFDSDNPPLWKLWAMLPNLGRELPGIKAADIDLGDRINSSNGGIGGFGFAAAMKRLYQTPGIDGDSWIIRSRAMMLIIAIGLAAVVALWAWQASRAQSIATASLAMTVACTLFCFDPEFLANGMLMKADVAVAFIFTCTAWLTWRVGQRATILNIIALAILCGAAVVVKFNGLLAPIFSAALLTCRVIMISKPWPALGRSLERRTPRCAAVLAIGFVAVAFTTFTIWACYGFRYLPSRDGDTRMAIQTHVRTLRMSKLLAEGNASPTETQIESTPMHVVARVIVTLDEHRLLPQAWLSGLLSIYSSSTTIVRQSYLMGETSTNGWWYYFPVALLVKLPLATLATLAIAIAASFKLRSDRWTLLCLLLPVTAYALFAMTSNVNAGLRHLLPVLPPIYVFAGMAIAQLQLRWQRAFKPTAIALFVTLAIESLAAFPNYLSFFNAIARPNRLYLLGDSNFDWGQGLKAVAAWQRKNPSMPLYLGYYGTVDPAFYGIRYQHIPGGFPSAPNAAPTMLSSDNPPGVLMISATLLQGVNFPPEVRSYYERLRDLPPDGMIGDCIYLYHWPPTQMRSKR